MTNRRKVIPLYIQILIGMAAGVLLGLSAGKSVAWLGEIGRLIIQLIKTFALPLLFFAIVDAFLKTGIRARSAGRMVAVSLINASIALAIGMGISNGLKPGTSLADAAARMTTAPKGAPPQAPGQIDFVHSLESYVPTNLVTPFAENAVITVILIALLFGGALRGQQGRIRQTVEDVIQAAYEATARILSWIIHLIPLAVFTVVARVVGEQGLAPLRGLLTYVGVALLGLSLQVLIVYQSWIRLFVRKSLSSFWREAREPLVYALGASSSLATLPVTLRALERMKVSTESARLAACVGTNLNNDGILLYEAMAVLFVAQAHGIHLSLGQQIIAALSCALAGFGIAGIPEAGLISLSLVLSTVGLPLELLPLLLTVDWILSRARAATNVLADLTTALILDRLAGRELKRLVVD